MDNVSARLQTLIAELEAHPHVHIVCKFIGQPVLDETIAAVESALDAPLDVGLKAFYRACNGVCICWQNLLVTPARSLQPHRATPMSYFEESEGGHFIVDPIEEVFGARMANDDLREVAAEMYQGDPVVAFGTEFDAETYFSTVWTLSYFFENNAVLINSAVRDGETSSFVVQGDQGLESFPHDGLTFESWFDFTVRTYGATSLQRDISRGWDPDHGPDSLDALVSP